MFLSLEGEDRLCLLLSRAYLTEECPSQSSAIQTSTDTPTIQSLYFKPALTHRPYKGIAGWGTEEHCTCCHTNRSWQMDAQMRGRHLIRNASSATSPHHTGCLWLSAGLRRPCPTSATCLPLRTLVNHFPPLSMYIAHYPITPPLFHWATSSLSQASWRVHCVTWNLSPPLFAPWKMCQLEFHADGGQKKGLNILKVYFTA